MRELPPYRIGIIAPPWLPVPPSGYGGTELVLDVLARGLQERGHDVRLFTLGASTCDVTRKWLFETADPDRMGAAIPELRHAAAAYDALGDCDIVHDHTIAGLFLAQLRPTLPVVTTNHGPFNADLADCYRHAAAVIPIIAISHHQASLAPADIPISAVIHHGLDLDRYPVGRGDGDYLLALGRMNPDKGIDTAIDVARRAGRDLRIAAKMREPAEQRYFEEAIRPRLGRGIEYVGEVDHEQKVQLLAGAAALINPLRWPEPFGLVMAESLACGTPVVATTCGAAPEIVAHGRVGLLGDSVGALVRAVGRLDRIDRTACRVHAEQHFTMQRMAADHEALYRQVVGSWTPGRKARRPQLTLTSIAGSTPSTAIA